MVLVNGRPRKAGWKLKAGDVVDLTVIDPEPIGLEPEDIPIDVVYEDKDLLVLNKQAGLVVHPSPGHSRGTLVNALLHHCGDLVSVGGYLRPGIVHRLDKDTSGLMVVSKSDAAHRNLSEQFKKHTIDRAYIAIVRGNPRFDQGAFRSLHGRSTSNRLKFTSRVEHGRQAVTRFRVIERFKNFALVQARLETGRTHQVRVHFSENGMPILGDPLYGRTRKSTIRDKELLDAIKALGRQALHAAELGFDHPVTGEHLNFTSSPPEDMEAVIIALRRLKDS